MDTIMIIRDSVAKCVNETAAICQPCVKEADTNWQDVIIWVTLFIALTYVIRYGIKQYFKWKNAEREASTNAAKEKRKNDVEDRQWKLSVDKEAHDLKRKEDKEDHDKKLEEEQKALDKKRKVVLQDKLQSYMESQLKEGEAIADNDKYIDELRKMIDAL